jgi:hypothetical protein
MGDACGFNVRIHAKHPPRSMTCGGQTVPFVYEDAAGITGFAITKQQHTLSALEYNILL